MQIGICPLRSELNRRRRGFSTLLYQLSYEGLWELAKGVEPSQACLRRRYPPLGDASMVDTDGFEPSLDCSGLAAAPDPNTTLCCTRRDRQVRTADLLHPMQARYQASLYPGRCERVRTSGLDVPNVALSQAELHTDVWPAAEDSNLTSPCTPGRHPTPESNRPATRRGTCASAPAADVTIEHGRGIEPRPSRCGGQMRLTPAMHVRRSADRFGEGITPQHLCRTVTLFRHMAQSLARRHQHQGGPLPACTRALIVGCRCTALAASRELPDRCLDDVTLPRVFGPSQFPVPVPFPEQGMGFSHETTCRSTGRGGGTRTHGVCLVRTAFLPLNYTPKRNAGCQ